MYLGEDVFKRIKAKMGFKFFFIPVCFLSLFELENYL